MAQYGYSVCSAGLLVYSFHAEIYRPEFVWDKPVLLPPPLLFFLSLRCTVRYVPCVEVTIPRKGVFMVVFSSFMTARREVQIYGFLRMEGDTEGKRLRRRAYVSMDVFVSVRKMSFSCFIA